MRAISTTALLCKQTEEIVMGSPLTIYVPHSVESLLNSHYTQHFSVSRLASYEVLSAPNITLTRCNRLNPATLLPSLQDGDTHNCVLLTDHLLAPRNDLQGTPIDNADLIWFTDGSYLKDEQGHFQAGYAITSMVDIIESSYLPGIRSAQPAELIALTRAYQLAKGQVANLYTDSRYEFGVAHDFGMLWKQRGFLTSSGQPIKNGKLVAEFLDAIQQPKQLAIIKIPGHSKATTMEAKGNHFADAAAKQAALNSQVIQTRECSLLPIVNERSHLLT